MAGFPLLNCKILLGQYDISGSMNSISIARSAAEIPADVFGASKTFRERIAGLGDGVIGMAGLVDLTEDGQDEILSTNMALSNIPILITLKDATDFQRCKFGVIQQGQYQSGGNAGNRAEWTAEGRISSYVLTDGWVMAPGAKTGTFNGTWRELGEVATGSKLYASIHATAKDTFTSAVFKVQSADDGSGTNVTDRITFATITDLVALFATPVEGPITQTFWRVICSAFTGTSLTVYPTVGIAPF